METIIILFVLLMLLYFLLPYAAKGLLSQRVLRQLRANRAVFLTFDDGPDPAATPDILELLRAAGATATFFVLGRQAAAHPELMRRVAAEGHGVGEHGFGHRHAWRTDPVRYACDLLRGRWVLDRLRLPTRSNLYRPAYGEMNLITLFYLLMGRRRLVMWDVNPRDFDAQSGAEVARRVIEDMRPGCVVLLHDSRAGVGTGVRVTVEAVKLILEHCARQGMPVRSIPGVLSAEHA